MVIRVFLLIRYLSELRVVTEKQTRILISPKTSKYSGRAPEAAH